MTLKGKKKLVQTSFGKNLKFLRRLNGLSQEELAKSVHLNRNKVASYESGMVEPNIDKFLIICDFFCIDHREILETVLSENPTDTKPIVDKSEPVIDKYLKDQMDQFIIQTNEMTKILEGYKSFFELLKEENEYEKDGALYGSFEDLLNLLQTLIKSNWFLIQSVLPDFEEEDCEEDNREEEDCEDSEPKES